MRHISETVYGMLMSQGIAHGWSANQPAQGMSASAPSTGEEAAPERSLIAQARNRLASETELGKGRGTMAPPVNRETRQNDLAEKTTINRPDFRVHTNPNLSNMPKDLRARPYGAAPAGARKSLLMVIQGGKPQ